MQKQNKSDTKFTCTQKIIEQDIFAPDFPWEESVKERLKKEGYGYEWIKKIVSPDEKGCVFIKKGRMYYSNCPYFEGVYLNGGFSSVKCKNTDLLPGLQFDYLCSKNFEECKFFNNQ